MRRLAFAIRPGYRLHRRDLPGRPDLAYGGARLAIFVHGCFWHGHDCARGARLPKTNRRYWSAKIAGNAARDAQAARALRRSGWRADAVGMRIEGRAARRRAAAAVSAHGAIACALS